MYKNVPETADIIINNNESIPFVSEFCYLGSIIDFLLDDTSDIKSRILKANCAVGALKCIWNAPEISLNTKVKLFLAIPVNFALWNCETWSGNLLDLSLLDSFYHKAIRRVLNIRMSRVKSEHLSNSQLRKMFGDVKPLSEIWRFRLLKFVRRTIQQDYDKISRIMMTACVKGSLIRGRPF